MVNQSASKSARRRCRQWLSKQDRFTQPFNALILLTGLLLAVPTGAAPVPPILMQVMQELTSDQYQGRKFGQNKELADWLAKQFSAVGLAPHRQRYLHPFQRQDKHGYNLIGIKHGAGRGVIVITAHYDHLGTKGGQIYYGADDNASGVAVMLALAAGMRDYNNHLTWYFIATDGEEAGLLGAKALFSQSQFITKPNLNINLDMLARSERSCRLNVFAKPSQPWLTQWRNTGRAQGCSLTPARRWFKHGSQRIDWLRASDHYVFNAEKINVVFVGGSQHSDYHSHEDTLANINHRQLHFAYHQLHRLLLLADSHQQ